MTAIPDVVAADARWELVWAGFETADGNATASAGVHVLSPDGKHLGLIPTPRPPISVAFSGADKKTLYVPQLGASGRMAKRGRHLRECGTRQ